MTRDRFGHDRIPPVSITGQVRECLNGLDSVGRDRIQEIFDGIRVFD